MIDCLMTQKEKFNIMHEVHFIYNDLQIMTFIRNVLQTFMWIQ